MIEPKRGAQRSLNYALEQFMTYTTKHKTRLKYLSSLGWKLSTDVIKAPELRDLLMANEDLRDLFDNKFYSTNEITLNIPL